MDNTSSIITFESIEDEIELAESDARSEMSKLRVKKNEFIEKQTFTGKELFFMSNLLKNGCSSHNNPYMDNVLERILQERNK